MPAGSRIVSGWPLTVTVIDAGPDGSDRRLDRDPVVVPDDLQDCCVSAPPAIATFAFTIAPVAGRRGEPRADA